MCSSSIYLAGSHQKGVEILLFSLLPLPLEVEQTDRMRNLQVSNVFIPRSRVGVF